MRTSHADEVLLRPFSLADCLNTEESAFLEGMGALF